MLLPSSLESIQDNLKSKYIKTTSVLGFREHVLGEEVPVLFVKKISQENLMASTAKILFLKTRVSQPLSDNWKTGHLLTLQPLLMDKKDKTGPAILAAL